jgi:hypothetical protein
MNITLRDTVEVRILNGTYESEFICKRFGDRFVKDADDFVFRAPAGSGSNAADQLIWLYAALETHRNLFRQLEGAGIRTVCRIRFAGKTLLLPPEAVQLAHFLHIATEIEHLS